MNRKILEYRHTLHSLAELGNSEILTSEFIIKKLALTNPDEIIKNIGGYGIAAVYGKNKSKTVMLRCELDALPIIEENELEYKSINENVSHKCGHDGHMSILLGVAEFLKNFNLLNTRVILLFQPDEETGHGAVSVLNDEQFKTLTPDYIFALHNLPGYSENSILSKSGVFAYASQGIIIKLKGKTSHAAEPENAINPKNAIIQISNIIDDLSLLGIEFNRDTFGTTVHFQLGSHAFGTTPGSGIVMGTLRAYENEDLNKASKILELQIEEIAKDYNLEFSIEWSDKFSNTNNNTKAFNLIKKASELNNLSFTEIQNPFKWTEDFGYFTQNIKGAMFGLGAGKNQLPLHNPKYDFPDQISEAGINMFTTIIKLLEN